MKVTLRFSLLLLGLGETRLARAAVRHGLSYRQRGKRDLFQECLHQTRRHARLAGELLREWMMICVARGTY